MLGAGLLGGCYVYPPSPDAGACTVRAPLALHAPAVGVHALFDPVRAAAVGAWMVRLIVSDTAVAEVRAAIERGETPEFVQMLDGFAAQHMPAVLTLRWPATPDVTGNDPDRIPTGADRAQALEQVDWLVRSLPSGVRYLQLNNEPIGGPGRYDPAQQDAALAWLGDVAETICRARAAVPALHDLRIVGPGLTAVGAIASGEASAQLRSAVEALVDFAERYADLLDIHLHVASATT